MPFATMTWIKASCTGTKAPSGSTAGPAREALGRNANELLFQDDLAAPMAALKNLIRQGEWQGELHQVTKGDKKIIVESRWTLMRDARGEPKSILIINTDVTEKKQIEAQFLRTQRMETIGALAGGIAHDLNNSLTPVLMALSFVQQRSWRMKTPKNLSPLPRPAPSAARTWSSKSFHSPGVWAVGTRPCNSAI